MKALIRVSLLVITILFAIHGTVYCQTFGRYGECTSGRGICGIITENIITPGSTSEITERFTLEYKNDSTVILKVYKANISAADESKIFGTTLTKAIADGNIYGYIDTDVPVAPSIRALLNIADKYTTISKGVYLMTNTSAYLKTELKFQ